MSGRDDESCDIMRSGVEAGGIRRDLSEGVAEERRGGRSGSGRQVGVGSIRGSSYRGFPPLSRRIEPIDTTGTPLSVASNELKQT